jgi:CBS-domain-containing membrane protein
MDTAPTAAAGTRLSLRAGTAADLMTPNPVSIRDNATIAEAVALFTDKGISAAPVIDEAGRAVGVLSRTDILVHDRERSRYVERPGAAGPAATSGPVVEKTEATRVRDLMTPVVFSVMPDTPAGKVVLEMVALKVHRLFVIDGQGDLVGVISALDVLRHLG